MPLHLLISVGGFAGMCAAVAAGLWATLSGLGRLERLSGATAPAPRHHHHRPVD